MDEISSPKRPRLGNNKLNNVRRVDLSDSDYNELNGCLDFIDKSLFAWHFLHDSDSRLLATAPSRFGKTSILKMLEKFFAIQLTRSGIRVTNVKQEGRGLVEDLSSMSENFKTFRTKKIFKMCHCSTPVEDCNKCKQWFYEHCGQHPVILIDFGAVKSASLEEVMSSLDKVIRRAYKQHEYLVTEVNGRMVWSSTQNEIMHRYHVTDFLMYYRRVEHDQFWLNANISQEEKKEYLEEGLPFLAECLSLHFETEETGKGVILLVDEFDAFVCEMVFNEGEKQEIQKNVNVISRFIRYWTRTILKNCNFVKKALFIACCAMGGILSLGANNTQQRLFLNSHPYSESFGFTEQEVELLVDVYLREDNNTKPIKRKEEMLKNIGKWYNGYSVINTKKKIFSPYSILCYLRSLELCTHWTDKVSSSRLDSLLAETPFQTKVFQLLNSPESTTIINIVKRIEPNHICSLNELIKNPKNVNKEKVDLFLQFLTDCGFFNVIKKKSESVEIKIPNFEIDCRLREKVLSGILKKRICKFDSSKITALIASLKSLKYTSASLRDRNIPLCIQVAKSIADLYTNTEIPNNHFKIQADLYFLINEQNKCYAELKIDTGNSPRIDIFFNINNDTSVVMEIKHFNSADGVDVALQQILDKKYYRVCANHTVVTEKKILLGVFLAHNGKVSVGCLVNIDEKNSEQVMKRRVCVDSDGNTLFPLE